MRTPALANQWGGVEAEGRASGDVVADVAAESGAKLFVDEGVGDFPEER
jgi:hypothetical protein